MAQPRRQEKRDVRDPKAEHSARKPDTDTVFDFHTNADTDAGPSALHHTLGSGITQAAPGTHTHDANSPDSSPLWTGVVLSDPDGTATNAQLAAAITALNALVRQKSA